MTLDHAKPFMRRIGCKAENQKRHPCASDTLLSSSTQLAPVDSPTRLHQDLQWRPTYTSPHLTHGAGTEARFETASGGSGRGKAQSSSFVFFESNNGSPPKPPNERCEGKRANCTPCCMWQWPARYEVVNRVGAPYSL